jgi:pimeloyl-ACP methyl ester carboxylesterase
MKRLILTLLTGAALAASSPAHAAVKTIVLVHGAFADGSGWKPVADILQGHGYSVLVVQEPETSFAADVAATRRVLDKTGPCVLVGHSYGGMIITETGMHPDIKALVYIAAVQPDVGESLSDLADKMPPAAKSIGPVVPHQQAGHVTAPDQCCSYIRKFLPRRRPHVTHSGLGRLMSDSVLTIPSDRKRLTKRIAKVPTHAGVHQDLR